MTLQKLREFSRENYLSIILGFLIVASAFSYIGKINSGHTYNQILETKMPSLSTPTITVSPNASNTTQVIADKHVVQKGENLWQIAQKYYASGYNYHDLAQINLLKNPNYLQIGQVIVLPSKVTSFPPTTGRTSSITSDEDQYKDIEQTYIVQKGDTLSELVFAKYHDPYLWKKVAEYNKFTRPHHIEIGQKIILPSTDTLGESNLP